MIIGKVTLTEEQANEIKGIQDIAYAIDIHSFNKCPDKAIAGLSTADLARALLIGYEIEPEYKVGDWVLDIGTNIAHQVIEVYSESVKVEGMVIGNKLIRHATPVEIEEATKPKLKVGDWAKVVFTSGGQAIGIVDTLAFDDIIFDYLDQNTEVKRCRMHRNCATTPTPEEIKVERERRVWAKIGRKVGEFRIGDIRILDDGNSVRITDVDYARAKYIQGSLKGFFPVESFISFEECESNA